MSDSKGNRGGAPRGNQNNRRHGLYHLERVARGAASLDRRTRTAREIAALKAEIARDRGFSSWADVPALLRSLITRAAYRDRLCAMVEAIPVEHWTKTMKEDYEKWTGTLLKLSERIGTDRLSRDITPSQAAIREAYTVRNEETESEQPAES